MSAGPIGVEERQVWRHPQTQRVMRVAYVTKDERQRLVVCLSPLRVQENAGKRATRVLVETLLAEWVRHVEKPEPFPLTVYAKPESETECGTCPLGVGRICAGFGGKVLEMKPLEKFGAVRKNLRLPECVKAGGAA